MKSAPLFDRMNGPARRAVQVAFREARRREHDFVGTQHLLFGLLCDEAGPAGTAVRSLGQVPALVLAALEEVLHDQEPGAALDQFPLSPAVQRALGYAAEEAARLGQALVGPEHLLLAILREPDTQAAMVLARFSIALEPARRAVGERPASEKHEFLLQAGARTVPPPPEPTLDELEALVAPLVPRTPPTSEADEEGQTHVNGEAATPDIAVPALEETLRHAAAVERQLRRTQLLLGGVLGFYFGHVLGGWQLGALAALGGICLALLRSSFAGAWMGFMAGFFFLPSFLHDGDERLASRSRLIFGVLGALLGSFLGDFWRRPNPVNRRDS